MTSNREWLESLAVDNPAELTAWFDAEHVDACPISGVDNHKAMIAGVEINNSDEGLRQEALQLFFAYPNISAESAYFLAGCVAGFLDRQAEITSCECAKINSQRLGELHRLLDEAAEEREKLHEELNEWKHSHPLALNQLDSKSDARIPVENTENDATKDDIRDFDDSREKLEADMVDSIYSGSFGCEQLGQIVTGWLDRQAAITRITEQAEWIKQANGLIHEANVERDELRGSLDTAKQLIEQYKAAGVDNLRKIDELRDELAKRDKGIARLKRQRDEAREFKSILAEENDELQQRVDKLKSYVDDATNDYAQIVLERDNLASDLATCNREREGLRKMLGIAIDHAHNILQLMNNDFAAVDNEGNVV